MRVILLLATLSVAVGVGSSAPILSGRPSLTTPLLPAAAVPSLLLGESQVTPGSSDVNMTTAIHAVVESLFATQRAKNCTAFAELFAPTFSVQDPYGSTPITSQSQLAASCQASNKAFSTITVFPQAVYVAGAGAGVLWTVTSVATNGCSLNFNGIDSILVDSDAKITQLHGFYDAAVPAQQMNCSAVPQVVQGLAGRPQSQQQQQAPVTTMLRGGM